MNPLFKLNRQCVLNRDKHMNKKSTICFQGILGGIRWHHRKVVRDEARRDKEISRL